MGASSCARHSPSERVLMMTLACAALIFAAQIGAATPPTPAIAFAPIEIVIFSDFQCPYCARFARAIRQLQAQRVDGIEMKFSFKNFPLSLHARAPLAHRAAAAAAEQGKFWEMHDLLFANQARATRDDLMAFARQLWLDMPRFVTDLDGDHSKTIVEADVAEAGRRHVTGTPTFFVNGHQYVGTRSVAEMTQIVQNEHRRERALAEITDESTGRGPSAASVTIELFADLQSSLTGPAAAVVNDVMARFPSQVRVQFRNFPLAFHPQASAVHEAAMAAAGQGRFWEFVAQVLEQRGPLHEPDLSALADRLGLDRREFARAIQEHRYAPRVEDDIRDGLGKGIRGSPTILVNGRRIDGVPTSQTLTQLVEAALAHQPATRVP
jgi:protein-disulfide isomerase